MDRLEVRSADERAVVDFVFVAADRGYCVEARADGLTASIGTDLSWSTLHGFFDSLAKDWRGWEGTRAVEARRPTDGGYSLPCLRLTATADQAGHFSVIVELAEPFVGTHPASGHFATHAGVSDPVESGAWRTRLVLILETWQLDGLAAGALELARAEPPGWY